MSTNNVEPQVTPLDTASDSVQTQPPTIVNSILAMDTTDVTKDTSDVAKDTSDVANDTTDVANDTTDVAKDTNDMANDHGAFNTPSFKLCLANIGKYMGKKEIVTMLEKSEIPFRNVKKGLTHPYGFVTFHNGFDKEVARKKLVTLTAKNGEPLVVAEPKMSNKPRGRRAKQEDADKPVPTCIEDVVSPLWKMPYEEQLELKQQNMIKCLRRISRQVRKQELKNNLNLYEWLNSPHSPREDGEEKPVHNSHGEVLGCGCPIEKILPSPDQEQYRNKCEFTFGLNGTGEKALGFRMGSYENNNLTVESPTNCSIVPDAMKEVCNAVLDFLSNQSDPVYPLYDMFTKQGVWRTLMLRYAVGSSTMMALLTLKDDADCIVDGAQLDDVLQKLVAHLTEKKLVVSFYVCRYNGTSTPPAGHPTEKLFGDDGVEEVLLEQRFSIAPDAFFQVNSKGAEVLYSKVRDWATTDGEEEKPKQTVVLDVCCGTGTIGLLIAPKVDKVVGIEMCESAVLNARENAVKNGVSNIRFVAARAEHVMDPILKSNIYLSWSQKKKDDVAKKLPSEVEVQELNTIAEELGALRTKFPAHDCVAVVDPPRSGLHPDVLRFLRGSTNINKIIYVSCNPSGSLVTDSVKLCQSKGPGLPFKPVKACPVDLFPQTDHCEMVVMYERQKEAVSRNPNKRKQRSNDWRAGNKKRQAMEDSELEAERETVVAIAR